MFYIKICQWLESNCGPLVLEATALPTEPQPLPIHLLSYEGRIYPKLQRRWWPILNRSAPQVNKSAKARSEGLRETHQTGLFIHTLEKHTQIEKILSTAFYAANYAGLI